VTVPHHVTVTLLDEPTARALVDAVVAGNPPPGHGMWLYAAARDGLITGFHRPDKGVWACSSDMPTDSVGTLRADTLHTVRIFGEAGETQLRATPTGSWRGRILTDGPTPPVEDPTAPITRRLLLATGRRQPVGADFARVTTSGGRTHVIPAAWSGRLVVRDYLAAHPHTGQLRIACSRCVHVEPSAREAG
jgi:hypothetical protein